MDVVAAKRDFKFPYGLTLTTREYPQYPMASICINILDSGCYAETVFQQHHLIEHVIYMTMKQQVEDAFDMSMNAQTGLQTVQYMCRLPAVKLASFCQLFLDSVLNPASFSSSLIEREKQAIKNELGKARNPFDDLLPLMGWARPSEENWPAFDALSPSELIRTCSLHYRSPKIHIEVAGLLTGTVYEELLNTLNGMDYLLRSAQQNTNFGLPLAIAEPVVVVNSNQTLVGYFCEVDTPGRHAYLTMACAHHLFHAHHDAGLYHKLRFEHGYIYGLTRAYHLFQGRGQYALFAQVRPEHAVKVSEEFQQFFSSDGEPLLTGCLPWAAGKCFSSQMLAMESLGEVTKRASQYYANFGQVMQDGEFYNYLETNKHSQLRQDIQNNYFNKNIRIIQDDRG